MNLTYDEVRAICGVIGLVIFVGIFLAGVIWVLLPSNKKDMNDHKNIPFEDGEKK